jgi:hypothetical protein
VEADEVATFRRLEWPELELLIPPDYPCDFSKMLDERGRMRLWRLAIEPLRTPQRLPALIRFALASRRAACRLAGFLDGYMEALLKSRLQGAAESPKQGFSAS